MSSVHLATFATPDMTRARDLCIESALLHGVEKAWGWDEHSLGAVGRLNGITFEPGTRGYSFWKWKPLIILKTMEPSGYFFREPAQDGDIVCYMDAGVETVNNLRYVVDRMDQDIWLYGNEWPHYMWCKRDIVEAVWPAQIDHQSFLDAAIAMSTPSNIVGIDSDSLTWQRFGNQVQASVIFLRVNDRTRAFVKEWLDWCLTGARIGAAVSFGKDNAEHRDEQITWSEFRYLIDDSPSVFPNHPEFRENRHDQAILTTLAYRDGIKLHPWNVKYLTFEPARREGYPEDAEIPCLYLHHRLRDDSWHEYESRTQCL